MHRRLRPHLRTEYAGEIRAPMITQCEETATPLSPSLSLSFLSSQTCYLCTAPSMATPLVLPLPSALFTGEGMVYYAARLTMTKPIYPLGWWWWGGGEL